MVAPSAAKTAAGKAPVAATAAGGPAVFTALRVPLHPALQLITLQMHAPGEVLLRLAHRYAIDEDTRLSPPVCIYIASLFDPSAVVVTDAREVRRCCPEARARREGEGF